MQGSASVLDRCRIVLLCADGPSGNGVVGHLEYGKDTVGKWRKRFFKDRIEGLCVAYRTGRTRSVSDTQVAEVIKRTPETTLKDADLSADPDDTAQTWHLHSKIRRT